MKILGIETSCDETAMAVVEDGQVILSNVVASSSEMHTKYGGIVPEVAARRQIEVLIPVLVEALQNIPLNEIDAIAVTVGPGLVGSLLVGIETAKTLAFAWNKPIVPVNHLIGHLHATWLNTTTTPEFPMLGMVVSGGHTDLVLMQDHGKLKYLGSTRDDAAGEAFDKIARMLGLGYPGGPEIAAEAANYSITKSKIAIRLPRPMINSGDYDFSFSGLKTAVVNVLREHKLTSALRQIIAYETQETICEVLVSKVSKAAEEYRPHSIVVAGGVAANTRLRELMTADVKNLELGIQLFIPAPDLCTDNATYIAGAAFFNYSPLPWSQIHVDPGLEIVM